MSKFCSSIFCFLLLFSGLVRGLIRLPYYVGTVKTPGKAFRQTSPQREGPPAGQNELWVAWKMCCVLFRTVLLSFWCCHFFEAFSWWRDLFHGTTFRGSQDVSRSVSLHFSCLLHIPPHPGRFSLVVARRLLQSPRPHPLSLMSIRKGQVLLLVILLIFRDFWRLRVYLDWNRLAFPLVCFLIECISNQTDSFTCFSV